MQAPNIIPVRPCEPDVPAKYDGLSLDMSGTPAFSAYTTTDKTGKKAVLSEGLTGANVAATVKSGFLQASTNTASTTTTEIANVGHVFGRMGEGERTMPSYTLNSVSVINTAFQWKDPAVAKHGMMFSILPTSQADSGLAATKKIEIKA